MDAASSSHPVAPIAHADSSSWCARCARRATNAAAGPRGGDTEGGARAAAAHSAAKNDEAPAPGLEHAGA